MCRRQIGDGTVIGRGGLVIGDLVNMSPEGACLTADLDIESPEFRTRARPVSVGSQPLPPYRHWFH